jgi:hypothetical protein
MEFMADDLDDRAPADNAAAAKGALDELFEDARHYRRSRDYAELLRFMARFPQYSLFNVMLVHTQMPGARYVATARAWANRWSRRLRPGARALAILQPKGPVMFVYDVSDTEPQLGAPPLPVDVERPFDAGGEIGPELEQTFANARRDGIRVEFRDAGSQSAGQIRRVDGSATLAYPASGARNAAALAVRVRYEVLLNGMHSRAARYATLVHELGHLYCGHLGTPDTRWWPSRTRLDDAACEAEAESVCYLVCARAGVDSGSTRYVAGWLDDDRPTPALSLDTVIRAATLVESMGRGYLPPRTTD